jgi:1-acyl-sn-glycerol-3-phosphate acyltransferase
MNSIRKVFVFLFSIYAVTLFAAIVILALPFIGLAMLLPKNKRGDGLYSIFRFVFDLVFISWGIYHKNIKESNQDAEGPVIYVYNHISYMDAMVILKTVRNKSIRALGKVEIANIPVLGKIYKEGVITVKRDSAEDRKRSVEDMKSAIAIIIAPEGTFNETDRPLAKFYDGAFRIALQTRTPIIPILILDTFDRMHFASLFSIVPGKSRSVLLDPVSVEGFSETEVDRFREHVYQIMELALVRYQAPWISKSK